MSHKLPGFSAPSGSESQKPSIHNAASRIEQKFPSPEFDPDFATVLYVVGYFIGDAQGVHEELVWDSLAKLIDKRLDLTLYTDCSLYTAERARRLFSRYKSVEDKTSLGDRFRSRDELVEKLRDSFVVEPSTIEDSKLKIEKDNDLEEVELG